MNRGRPHKDTDEVGNRKKIGWGKICSTISTNSGLSAEDLERHFGVGNGSGRSWNYWKSANQITDLYYRRKVVIKACEAGWLSTLTDVQITELVELQVIRLGDVVRGEFNKNVNATYDVVMNLLKQGYVSPDVLGKCVDRAREDLGLGLHETFKGNK